MLSRPTVSAPTECASLENASKAIRQWSRVIVSEFLGYTVKVCFQ